MKRTITLILLVIFLLNVVGYYGVFVGLRFTSEVALRQQFDAENYDQQEVMIKVPITIPYATDSRDFERVDGEFEHEGQVYRLVKQKLQSDTLYIVCVKDQQTQTINQALADYVKSYTDKPANAKQGTKTVAQFTKDFISCTTSLEPVTYGWNFSTTPVISLSDLYSFQFNQHIVQPPEA
ncbi:MAG: hypothetical protein HOP30_05525 [Cyclobacteriaceae bacterium]|nr:hypothetical protein [Cyclobacteriaceae bacterium]